MAVQKFPTTRGRVVRELLNQSHDLQVNGSSVPNEAQARIREFRKARAVAFDRLICSQQGRGHRPRGYDAQPTPEDGAAQLPRPLVRPEKGDQSRSTLVFSQPGQTGAAIGLTRWTNTSKTRPHSRHWYSNNGNALTSRPDVPSAWLLLPPPSGSDSTKDAEGVLAVEGQGEPEGVMDG